MAAAIGSDLSVEAYRRTLYQPYEIHLQRNTAEVITTTTSQISITVAGINAFLQLITSAVVATGLLVGLLVINASVAMGAAALFAIAYAALAITSRRHLRLNGVKIAETSKQQLKALQEGLGAIREVLLDGSQLTYLQIYRKADFPQRRLRAQKYIPCDFSAVRSRSLRNGCHCSVRGGIVIAQGGGLTVIPLLGSLALGAQRLLPALQQIYSGWAALKSYNAAMQDVLLMLSQPLPPDVEGFGPLLLHQGIRLHKVHYSYAPEQPSVLTGLDLNIHCGECIGLIGSTGSGKAPQLTC